MPVSISNFIFREKPGLAAEIIEKSHNEMFGSLRDPSSCLRRTDILQKGEYYFEIFHCLAETLNHFSSRDPSNMLPGSQEQVV
jgi:fido (protein-threonine AMPylation protein)